MTPDATRTTELPAPGMVLGGKYRVEGVIGHGGMAVVYAGTQLLTERRVAIKCLDPRIARSAEVVERFLREARAATSIDHASVVQVFDVGRADGLFYMVMELLAGETLRARLDRGRMDLEEALHVLVPVLGAVAAAHARGIVHRDLKPENVFLRRREDGSLRGAKVLDFGISKLSAEESLTLTGTVLGTPYYLSPEQASAGTTGPASDVYQLGALLYEMLGGRVPFDADNYASLLAAILTGTPVPLATLRPDLPPAIGAIVARAMARSTAERYPDVASFARDLAPFTDASDEALAMPRAVPHTVRGRAAVGSSEVDAMAPTLVLEAHVHDEPAPPVPAPRRGLLLLAVFALLAGIATTLGVGMLLMPPSAEPAGPAAAPEPIPSQPPAGTGVFQVTVVSTPEASVTVDGAPLGTTPAVVSIPPLGARVVELQAAGHAPREVVVRAGGPTRVEVTLDPIGVAAPEPAPTAPRERAARPPRDTTRPARPAQPQPRAGSLSADDF
jgi:tRNA A-37 threonylcarbamoyl transferase component Bud32